MISKFKTQHWIAIGLTLTLTVLLYFAPKKGEEKPTEMQSKPGFVEVDVTHYFDSVYAALPAKLQAQVLQQKELIKTSKEVAQRSLAYDSLAAIWKGQKDPFMMAMTMYSKSEDVKTLDVYKQAGKDCYMTSRFVEPRLQQHLLNKAIACFAKALEAEPNNLDTKTDLGVCYVENGQDPMKGIGLLREVVSTDSTNLKAQTSLGMFAIQSGQNDKAVKRFTSITKMYPENAEAYLFLAQSYANLGQKDKAVESLKIFKSKNTDKTIDSEIDSYIKSLTTNN